MGGGTGSHIPTLGNDVAAGEAVGNYYKSSGEEDTVYRVDHVNDDKKVVVRRLYSTKGHERVDRDTTSALEACANDLRVHDFAVFRRRESPALVTVSEEHDPADPSICQDVPSQ